MKKLTAISVFLLLVFSQIGYFLYYSIQLHQIKKAAQKELIASLPENSFTKICLEENTTAIKWEEENKEFSLNGKMYDVATIKIENGNTILYCLSDNKEDQVLDNLSSSVRARNENNSNTKHQFVIKFHLADFTITKIDYKNGYSSVNVSEKHFDVEPGIVSSFKKIITPPPEFCI